MTPLTSLPLGLNGIRIERRFLTLLQTTSLQWGVTSRRRRRYRFLFERTIMIVREYMITTEHQLAFAGEG